MAAWTLLRVDCLLVRKMANLADRSSQIKAAGRIGDKK